MVEDESGRHGGGEMDCSSAEAEARLSSCYRCARSAGIGPQLITEENRYEVVEVRDYQSAAR